jgi:hypothetical protein
VQAGLVNFAAFLKTQQKPALSRWIILNDCVRELHPAGLSLLDLTQDDVVFEALSSKYFSKSFLKLGTPDRRLADQMLALYKQYSKNSAIST